MLMISNSFSDKGFLFNVWTFYPSLQKMSMRLRKDLYALIDVGEEQSQSEISKDSRCVKKAKAGSQKMEVVKAMLQPNQTYKQDEPCN